MHRCFAASCAPTAKDGCMNQCTEPRNPKPVLQRGAGHGTGSGRELQEKLGLVGAGFCRQTLGSRPPALLGGGAGLGLAGGLHFWGFPCSPAPS